MKVESVGRMLVAISGLILMGIGIYFIFFRPPLLPEDLAFMKIDSQIHAQIPELEHWLKNVFTVLGGFAFTTGFLKVFAVRNFSSRNLILPIFLAWFSSIGLMTFVNFRIHSDFKWALFSLAALELIGIGALCISVIQQNRKS